MKENINTKLQINNKLQEEGSQVTSVQTDTASLTPVHSERQ